jgi:hypothetical protein
MEGIEKRERDEHSHERICMYTYDGRQRTNEGRLEEEGERDTTTTERNVDLITHTNSNNDKELN